MKEIELLDQTTIDKIAAGEVVERPASIVKELVENAIDAGANAVTVEIREGGISLIRITDNGEGMDVTQVPKAFLRHATSKIRKAEDLIGVTSLGFRGEALSSIAAVCQVELITKTPVALTGTRYQIEGGAEKEIQEIGAPEGSTFLVRNLFYNTPARKKFLKSPTTEAGYINDLIERLALSHPDVSFKFINHNQTRIHTSGNSNLKDIIYNVYGREIAAQLIPVKTEKGWFQAEGFIGKPLIARGNRNYENYFINGRYVKSKMITKAIEDAYKTFLMQHKYPFTALHFTMSGDLLDINVHPTKMELRFAEQEALYQMVYETVRQALAGKELIPEISMEEKEQQETVKKPEISYPEPFEKNRMREVQKSLERPEVSPAAKPCPSFVEEKGCYDARPAIPEGLKKYFKNVPDAPLKKQEKEKEKGIENESVQKNQVLSQEADAAQKRVPPEKAVQMDLFEEKLLAGDRKSDHRIIGQVFDTYWLVEFQQKLYIMDQHAAHEKVLYEQTMRSLKDKQFTSQYISPPLILSLSLKEEELLKSYLDNFVQIGFEIEHFGGREYSIRAVPDNLFGIAQKELFLEMLDTLGEQTQVVKPDLINEKIASMSCKAAVKGNHKMSFKEAEALIEKLFTLENPYHCPHGRPTIISMTKYEIEKKFKRIV